MELSLIWPYGKDVSKVKLIYESKIKWSERPKITSPHDAALLFRRYWNYTLIRQREEFKCLYLNQNYRVLAISEVGIGNAKSVYVKDKLMLSIAYQLSACSLIFCHNHPSGFLMPSDNDQIFTNRMMYAADIMQIRILDHIILSPYYRYYSFVAGGLIDCHKNLLYWRKCQEQMTNATFEESLVRKAA